MPAVTAAAFERVNAFPINGIILFKHYFEGDEIFARLKPYYNGSQYRFEVPAGEFDSLRRFLRDHSYDVCIVDRPSDYYVVVQQYSEHPDGIFKMSVHRQGAHGYNCFLMKDHEAVEDTVAKGAERLTSAPLALQSGNLADFAMSSP